MNETKKHIDQLVTTRNQKQAELLVIGREIASSSTPIIVAFVDLAESTRMKQDRAPEEWLGYVFEFIKRVDQRARDADGTVVKRIGDELMVTFKGVQASERFVDSLIADTGLHIYRYKIALDYGSAYHFRFLKHLPDDPYGAVVDRCARIAKYAAAGTAICTGEYRSQVGSPASYVSIGSFALRGFREPDRIASMIGREASVRARSVSEGSDATPSLTLRAPTAGDIVLLFRAMTNVHLYEAALRKQGLDYYLVGGRAFFAQQEIYDLLNLLRALENPQDAVSLAGTLRSPFCCLSDEALFVFGRHGNSLWAGLLDDSLSPRLPADQRERAA